VVAESDGRIVSKETPATHELF